MKIKLSKKQWESIGKKAGWNKKSSIHNKVQEEVLSSANVISKYMQYISELMNATDDIDDSDIQKSVDDLCMQINIILYEFESNYGKKLEDILIRIDQLQEMWWNENELTKGKGKSVLPIEYYEVKKNKNV
jgi:hypothetical protein